MAGYFKDLFDGVKSLAIGMKITNKELFIKPVTLQYPHESLKMTPRYRGHIELIRNPESASHNCVACGMCAKGCPSNCITVESKTVPGVKGKVLTAYILNFTTCSLCGECVESCKFGAIRFSNEYNLASTRKEDFIYNLLERLHPEGVPEPKVDPELLKKEEEKKAAALEKAKAKKESEALAATQAEAEKLAESSQEARPEEGVDA